MSFRIRSNWPYNVKRSPLFYGWMIWLLSTLGILMSIPGQTMGMAVFTEPFIAAFGLSRTQLSFAYLLGTLASASLLTHAGRLYDLLGGRIMVSAASLMLGLVLVYFSVLEHLIRPLGSGTPLVFAAVLLGYFGVRFSGQGVLTSASRNIMMHWFKRRVGLMSGLRGVFVSLGFSLAPLLLAAMIAHFGWRGALLVLATTVGIGFAGLALLTLRDNPEACGLLADGVDPQDAPPEAVITSALTLAQARRRPEFWLYSGALSIHSLFITAVTFHVVAVFAEAGRDSTTAFATFLPMAVTSTSTSLLASWFADRYHLKPFLVLMLAGFLTAALGMLMLSSTPGYLAMVLGFGIGGGLWGVLSNLAFVRFFGLLHLGAISGLNASMMVAASAFGPLLFSLSADGYGSYAAAYWVCLALVAALLFLAIVVPQHELQAPGADRIAAQRTG